MNKSQAYGILCAVLGHAMVKAKDRIYRAARTICISKRALAEARRTLARERVPGPADLIVAHDWRWAQNLLERHRASFLAVNGVVGLGLGQRIRDGVDTGDPSISVFVRRKYRRSILKSRGIRKLPRRVLDSKGRRLEVDVVPLGRIRRRCLVGKSLGPEWPKRRATLGVVGVDDESSAQIGITAMHATAHTEFEADGWPVPFFMPSLLEQGKKKKIGVLLRGTMTDIDAASVRLGRRCRNFIPGIGQIAGWRGVTYPGDEHEPVRMHGGKSGLEFGLIETPSADLPAEGLRRAIMVRINSQPGDSGAPLVDGSGYVLGFLVGEGSHGLRVFTPVALVLALLRCDIASQV